LFLKVFFTQPFTTLPLARAPETRSSVRGPYASAWDLLWQWPPPGSSPWYRPDSICALRHEFSSTNCSFLYNATSYDFISSPDLAFPPPPVSFVSSALCDGAFSRPLFFTFSFPPGSPPSITPLCIRSSRFPPVYSFHFSIFESYRVFFFFFCFLSTSPSPCGFFFFVGPHFRPLSPFLPCLDFPLSGGLFLTYFVLF